MMCDPINHKHGAVMAFAFLVVLLMGTAAQDRPYSLGGGSGGPDGLPPSAPAPNVSSPPSAPTLLKNHPLPTLIMSTASDRFLLRLRHVNGDLVDIARAEGRYVTVLHGPLDVMLLLDVLPIDGEAVPVLGIPVTAGAGVSVYVEMAVR